MVQPGEAQRNLANVHKYLVGGNEEGGVRIFSVIPMEKIRDYGFKMKHRRTLSEREETFIYCQGDQDLTQVAQRQCRVSILKESKTPPRQVPGNWLCLSRGPAGVGRFSR